MAIFPCMFAPSEKVRRSIPSDLERLLAPVAPTDARAAALACSGRSGVEKRTMRCVGSYSFPSSSVGHGESSSEVGGLGGPGGSLSSSLKMLPLPRPWFRTRRRLSRTCAVLLSTPSVCHTTTKAMAAMMTAAAAVVRSRFMFLCQKKKKSRCSLVDFERC